MTDLLIETEVKELRSRKISEETCRRFGYSVGRFEGEMVQIAPYNRNGRVVAQKIRTKDKEFRCLGDTSNMPFFGQQLWSSGKRVTVTEGEIDALSIFEAEIKGKYGAYPVVSVPNGAAGAAKTFKQELDWLSGFDKVIICFDQDAPGIKAANECAALLPPGKAFIAVLPRKDANDCLQEGLVTEIQSAMWNAQAWRPDGILDANEALSEILNRQDISSIFEYPFAVLNSMTQGVRAKELVTVCGGSGIGKSEFVRNIAARALLKGIKVGYLALEESVPRTALGLLGIVAEKPLYQDADPFKDPTMLSVWKTIFDGNFFCYRHFGSTDPQNLLARIRYMAVGLGCKVVVLDHISIVVSGIADGDERRIIDNLVTGLRSLIEETGICVIALSHLRRATDGEYHEEGAKTSLGQLRGSGAIGQLSDMVIGLERNQQSDTSRDVLTMRVLKNRYNGTTGLAGRARYNKDKAVLEDLSIADAEMEIES
jgi:twinkle protein